MSNVDFLRFLQNRGIVTIIYQFK